MKCDNCGYENEIGHLINPELRSANKTRALDFSLQSAVYSFDGIAAVGNTALQPITDRNLASLHIGQVAGQPLNGYLCVRDVFAIVIPNAVSTYAGFIVYRDTKQVNHYLASIAFSSGNNLAINNYRIRLLSENAISERELTDFGNIYVETNSITVGPINIRVRINYGVHYGI